jgi:hypothetical protein
VRQLSIIVLLAGLSAFASPALADTAVTTGNTVACGVDCQFNDNVALQPFNASLGTLTGITLQVDAHTDTAYSYVFPDFGANAGETGSAQLSFTSPFVATVNGATYSFTVSGDQTVIGTPAGMFTQRDFIASGSGTFTLDAATFNSFIGTATACGFASEGIGVCASGAPQISPSVGNIVAGTTNLTISPFQGFIASYATYTLTYTYQSLAVPEASSWAMMLIGFGAIGWSMRRRAQGKLAEVVGA